MRGVRVLNGEMISRVVSGSIPIFFGGEGREIRHEGSVKLSNSVLFCDLRIPAMKVGDVEDLWLVIGKTRDDKDDKDDLPSFPAGPAETHPYSLTS